jgi:hypothetical protein
MEDKIGFVNSLEKLTIANFIVLDIKNKRFSFQSKNEDGEVSGYADLSDNELEVFKNVFNRMANNITKED